VLFGFAGVVVDAWRAFAVRQDLAGMADSAAAAGATALDEDAYRATGAVVLDPDMAQTRAAEYLGRQEGFDGTIAVAIDATLENVAVTLEQDVHFTILSGFLEGEGPLRVGVTGLAVPSDPVG
jgi:Flp pilus assembly protein TadG